MQHQGPSVSLTHQERSLLCVFFPLWGEFSADKSGGHWPSTSGTDTVSELGQPGGSGGQVQSPRGSRWCPELLAPTQPLPPGNRWLGSIL